MDPNGKARHRDRDTKRLKIIEVLKEFPDMPVREVAAVTGSTRYYVYDVMKDNNLGQSPVHRRLRVLEQRMRDLEQTMIRFLEARRIDPSCLGS